MPTWQAELRAYQQQLAQTRETATKAAILLKMGLLAHRHQQFEQAAFYYRQSLTASPGAEAALYLGQIAARDGQRAEAEAYYRQALALKPEQAEIWVHLGLLQLERLELDAAEASLAHALSLAPGQAQALLNLARLCGLRHQWQRAETLLQTLLSEQPDSLAGLSQLGQIYLAQGLPVQAEGPLRQAVALGPRSADLSRLGAALHQQGLPAEALICFEQACALDSEDAQTAANGLNCRLNLMPWSAAELLQAFTAWGDRLSGRIRPLEHQPASWASGGRLRIGYLSADFREHSAARVYEWLFAHHDRKNFEIFAYANNAHSDAVSQRLARQVDSWLPVAGLSDAELIERIGADRIQILVDLSGHTAGHRLEVMARKPAPVQVTGLGHVFSTGLRAIDYRLSDAVCSPAPEAALSPEQILPLPSWLCWMPPAQEPPACEAPTGLGRPLLGSANHCFKMNPAVFETWSAILHRLPTASLLLKAAPFADPGLPMLYHRLFAAHGVAPERIQLQAASSYQDYLALYRHIDLCLDPFPYGGGLTTCDALWMNAQVLALDTGSRGSASLLHQIGAADWIAKDLADYVDKAVNLAVKPRQDWRQKLLAAPVCQGPTFARALEAGYRQIWRQFAEAAA